MYIERIVRTSQPPWAFFNTRLLPMVRSHTVAAPSVGSHCAVEKLITSEVNAEKLQATNKHLFNIRVLLWRRAL